MYRNLYINESVVIAILLILLFKPFFLRLKLSRLIYTKLKIKIKVFKIWAPLESSIILLYIYKALLAV